LYKVALLRALLTGVQFGLSRYGQYIAS